MKKKIISLCLVVALLAIAVVGGTFAYLQDTDADVNVMTSGKADIIQNEQQRVTEEVAMYDKYNPDGTPADDANIVGYDVRYAEPGADGYVALEDFVDDKLLVPAVYYNEDGTVAPITQYHPSQEFGLVEYIDGNAQPRNLMSGSVMNEVDKIITVTNQGTVPVYARTIILFEAPTWELFDDNIHNFYSDAPNVNGAKNSGAYNWVKDANGDYAIIELDGIKYAATVHYYEFELLPGQTTEASLKQVMMAPGATNETVDALLGADMEYEILALSQAVQADGFNDDQVALQAAFGDVTVDAITEWFADIHA